MQTPDQPPEKEQEAEQVSQPLYEFPSYPPPPSFYQNMPNAPERPALPAPSAPVYTVGGPLPSNATGYVPHGQGYVVGRQPPPFVPAPATQPPVKKSRTWIWIVVATLSVTLLASCGLCGWATYNLFSTAFQQVSGTLTMVDDYYTAIQAKNYAAAYKYLAPQGSISDISQEKFTQQAQSFDDRFGPVLSYTPDQPAVGTSPSPDFSRFTIVVNVSRSKLNYTVLLTLRKIGGNWKITDYDRI